MSRVVDWDARAAAVASALEEIFFDRAKSWKVGSSPFIAVKTRNVAARVVTESLFDVSRVGRERAYSINRQLATSGIRAKYEDGWFILRSIGAGAGAAP